MTMPPLPELPFFRYERHEVRMFLLDYAAAAYRAGQEEMRERAVMCCPGGSLCDPQQIADDIRALLVDA